MYQLSNFLDFYILETIKHFVNSDPTAEFDYAKCRLADDVYNELEDLCGNLSNALHDYIFLASFGEARHAQGTINFILDALEENGNVRTRAYKTAEEYSPEYCYKILYNLFTLSGWHGSYGGKLWANVINALDLIYSKKVPCGIFIDHCADLKHNGGLALDKPIVFEYDYDGTELLTILTDKRDALDFAKFAYDRFLEENYAYKEKYVHYRTSKLLRRYLKIYYNIDTLYSGEKKDTKYIPVKFGLKTFSIVDSPIEIEHDTEEEEKEEVYTEHCDGCGKLRSSHNQYILREKSYCHSCYDKRIALVKIEDIEDNEELDAEDLQTVDEQLPF